MHFYLDPTMTTRVSMAAIAAVFEVTNSFMAALTGGIHEWTGLPSTTGSQATESLAPGDAS